MKERPILFSGAMVSAILDGRKTVTRRVVTDVRGIGRVSELTHYTERAQAFDWSLRDRKQRWHSFRPDELLARCPYGVPGDRLWVQEAHSILMPGGFWARVTTLVDGEMRSIEIDQETWCKLEPQKTVRLHRGRPGRFMPRWASRISLEVVSVRVERLQQITGADILAEGVVARSHVDQNLGKCPVSAFDGVMYPDLMSLWRTGWDSINGERKGCSWADGPWVWVVEFRRVEG